MHISFDFDYTLADSSEGSVECANYALAGMGLQVHAPEEIRKTIGLSLERTFEELSEVRSEAAAEEFKQRFLERADAVMLRHIRFYDGTENLLRVLKRDGHYLSIVSTKYKKRIEQALRRDGLESMVDEVVGGECVRIHKPDPEGLHRAMEAAGSAPSSTLYVGDSVSDGECANLAGVGFVAVLSGTTTRSALERWQPLLILENVSQLAEVRFHAGRPLR